MEPIETTKIAIATIHDHGGTRLWNPLVEDYDIGQWTMCPSKVSEAAEKVDHCGGEKGYHFDP